MARLSGLSRIRLNKTVAPRDSAPVALSPSLNHQFISHKKTK